MTGVAWRLREKPPGEGSQRVVFQGEERGSACRRARSLGPGAIGPASRVSRSRAEVGPSGRRSPRAGCASTGSPVGPRGTLATGAAGSWPQAAMGHRSRGGSLPPHPAAKGCPDRGADGQGPPGEGHQASPGVSVAKLRKAGDALTATLSIGPAMRASRLWSVVGGGGRPCDPSQSGQDRWAGPHFGCREPCNRRPCPPHPCPLSRPNMSAETASHKPWPALRMQRAPSRSGLAPALWRALGRPDRRGSPQHRNSTGTAQGRGRSVAPGFRSGARAGPWSWFWFLSWRGRWSGEMGLRGSGRSTDRRADHRPRSLGPAPGARQSPCPDHRRAPGAASAQLASVVSCIRPQGHP